MAGPSTQLPNEVTEEDSSELMFPKEFENAETLLISEVFVHSSTPDRINPSSLVTVPQIGDIKF